MPDPVVDEVAGAMLGGNGHPADRVDRQALPACTGTQRSEHAHGLVDVAKSHASARLQLDALERAGELTRSFGQEDFIPARSAGYAGGQIDAVAQPIAVTLDGGAGVHADSDDREPGPIAQCRDDRQTEPDRVAWTVNPHHDCVADRLHLLPTVPGKQLANGVAELADELRRFLVAVHLGQRGEPGQVGEQEGVIGGIDGHEDQGTARLSRSPRNRWIYIPPWGKLGPW